MNLKCLTTVEMKTIPLSSPPPAVPRVSRRSALPGSWRAHILRSYRGFRRERHVENDSWLWDVEYGGELDARYYSSRGGRHRNVRILQYKARVLRSRYRGERYRIQRRRESVHVHDQVPRVTPGAVFAATNNVSANPISGTFVNLADGMTFSSGGNVFKADHRGGTGNDLILTVE
jgi:hypothetical protein